MISVIVSFRNEEGNLEELFYRVQKQLSQTKFDYEVIFVNDDSTDKSKEVLNKLKLKFSHEINVLNTPSRFGQVQCMWLGLKESKGDAIVFLDADLQDPPELIGQMVEYWQEGYDVVHTKRTIRLGENRIKMLLTDIAYWIINKVSYIDLPPQEGDYKLISHKVAIRLLEFDEENPYLRGLIRFISSNSKVIKYKRNKRASGKTKFSFWTLNPIETFFIGVTSFSVFPLYLPFIFCLFFLLSFLLPIGKEDLSLIANLFILFSLGVIGVYLARIHVQSRRRPQGFISKE